MNAADLAAQRAAIEGSIHDRTLVGALAATVARLGDAPALHWRTADGWRRPTPGDWHVLSWRELHDHVRAFAAALRRMGVGPGQFVVLVAGNHPAHLIADQAVMHAGATPVSLYPTLSVEQLVFHAGHCGARVAVVEGADRLERALAVEQLERIVVADAASDDPRVEAWEEVMDLGRQELQRAPGAGDEAASGVRPDDLATVIYTSGTTGVPKAVMVTHRMALWIEASLHLAAECGPEDRLVSYLPMAHIAERFLSGWQPAVRGASIWLCPDPLLLPAALAEVRPTWFFGVPRVWEKYAAALRPAWAQAEASGSGAAVAPMLLERIGLDRCRVAMTGGAPIDADVLELFRAIGLEVPEMWGMTESGPATWNGVQEARFGTVGKPMPGVEVRLAGDGELLVRGGNVTPGYYRGPHGTETATDADGWLPTGDLGTVDAEGYFSIVGRKKDVIITAGGKTIAPSMLERFVKRHPLVADACVVGDRRPYPSALIVLDAQAAVAWAEESGIAAEGLAALASDPALCEEIARAVDAVNGKVSRPEQIKRFTILPVEWTPASGELSATLKLKRHVIEATYAAEIENMYG